MYMHEQLTMKIRAVLHEFRTQHVLNNKEGLKVAVIVNDMSEVRIRVHVQPGMLVAPLTLFFARTCTLSVPSVCTCPQLPPGGESAHS